MNVEADPLQCSYCGARYKHVLSRYRHERHAHADRIARKSVKRKQRVKAAVTIKCPYCVATFSRAKDRQRHVNRMHSGKNIYHCVLCESSFNKLISLNWHSYKHHSNGKKSLAENLPTSLTVKSVPTPVRVKKNAKKLKTKRKKRATNGSVSTKAKNSVEIVYANELTCSYCPMFLGNASSKELHERRHTGKTSFVCESCGASFYSSYTYVKHKHDCSQLHTATWCKYCDFYSFEPANVVRHCKRMHGLQFESDVELESLRREVGSEVTDVTQSDSKACASSVEYERTEALDDNGVSNRDGQNSEESSTPADDQIVGMGFESEPNQRTEMIAQQDDVSVPDPNASPEYEETVAAGSMEQCDHPRSPSSAELGQQKIESNRRTETVVVQQHDGSEPSPNPSSSEYEGVEASNNAELSHCNDRNTKPELESESHQRTELVVHQENIPIEDPIVKYEVEVAQIDENLKEIFKTPTYRTIDLTEGSDEDDELPSRVVVVDIDDDLE